jgi:hypothetical protein
MANTSQDPDTLLGTSLSRGYVRVRFQQGKPLLDRELTLAADLSSPRRLAARYLGDGVADTSGFAVFALDVATGNFGVRAGRCLVGGLEVTLAADTTYRGQPHTANVAPLPAGASLVYLRVFTREVSGTEDADLLNAADVGFETARRDMVDWEIVVSAVALTAIDHFLLARIDTAGGTVLDQRRVGLSLSSVCDEVVRARGTGSSLNARLSASLENGGGLRANTVGTNQLGALAVTTAKLAALAVTEPKLADSSVSRRTVQAGTVTIQKLATVLLINGAVSLPGGPSDTVIMTTSATAHAFFLVSVRLIGSLLLNGTSRIEWLWRARLTQALSPPTSNQAYELVLRNLGAAPVSADLKVYQLTET